MKYLFLILAIALSAACSTNSEKNNEQTDTLENSNTEVNAEDDTEIFSGERIDGPANIRDRVNGTTIATLNDNVLVETSPQQDDWYKIGIDIRLTDAQVKDLQIQPNTDLYSTDGQIVGKSLQTIEIWVKYGNTGYFEAYTHVDNIKQHTIPEGVLEGEINNGNLTYKTLKSFIKTFQFTDIGENPDLQYRQFYIMETQVVDPSPGDRITLFFDKTEQLVCFVHSRKLDLENFKTYDLVRGYSLTFVTDPGQTQVQKIIDERNQFYNSVD